MIPRNLGSGATEAARRVTFGLLAAIGIAIVLGGLRWTKARGEVADLRLAISDRQKRLAGNRRVAGSLPPAPAPVALDRSRAVSNLRATLASVARGNGVVVDEFQASTEEAPYLTLYASDNQDPGWMQVPVRVSLRGRTAAILQTILDLRKLETPFEIDSTEVTRRSTDKKGMAMVVTGIGLRVLVYRGES